MMGKKGKVGLGLVSFDGDGDYFSQAKRAGD